MEPVDTLVLIIEDSVDIQATLQELFEAEGYQVRVCSNGRDALEYLHLGTETPNIILLDIMMPIMDGYEFRRLQRADPRLNKIPVIVMTADGSLSPKKDEMQTAAFLKKPVDIDVLLNTVNQFSV